MKTALPSFSLFRPRPGPESRAPYAFETRDGRSSIATDTSAARELTDRAEHQLAPVLVVWYPT